MNKHYYRHSIVWHFLFSIIWEHGLLFGPTDWILTVLVLYCDAFPQVAVQCDQLDHCVILQSTETNFGNYIILNLFEWVYFKPFLNIVFSLLFRIFL